MSYLREGDYYLLIGTGVVALGIFCSPCIFWFIRNRMRRVRRVNRGRVRTARTRTRTSDLNNLRRSLSVDVGTDAGQDVSGDLATPPGHELPSPRLPPPPPPLPDVDYDSSPPHVDLKEHRRHLSAIIQAQVTALNKGQSPPNWTAEARAREKIELERKQNVPKPSVSFKPSTSSPPTQTTSKDVDSPIKRISNFKGIKAYGATDDIKNQNPPDLKEVLANIKLKPVNLNKTGASYVSSPEDL